MHPPFSVSTELTEAPTAAPTSSPTGSPVAQEQDVTLQEWAMEFEEMMLHFMMSEVGFSAWIDCISSDFTMDLMDGKNLSFAEAYPIINALREAIVEYHIVPGTDTVRVVDAYTLEISYEVHLVMDQMLTSWSFSNKRCTVVVMFNEHNQYTHYKVATPSLRNLISVIYHVMDADVPTTTQLEEMDLNAVASAFGYNPLCVVAVIVAIFTMGLGIGLCLCVKWYFDKRSTYQKVLVGVESELE